MFVTNCQGGEWERKTIVDERKWEKGRKGKQTIRKGDCIVGIYFYLTTVPEFLKMPVMKNVKKKV